MRGMVNQIKYSAFLLIFLGVLFSIPIAAKTWSAHGAAPAIATSLMVVVSVFIGPLSFVVADAVDVGFIDATTATTGTEAIGILVLGVALLLAWVKSLARGAGFSASYLPVMGWALLGAYFCVSLVFKHTT